MGVNVLIVKNNSSSPLRLDFLVIDQVSSICFKLLFLYKARANYRKITHEFVMARDQDRRIFTDCNERQFTPSTLLLQNTPPFQS